MQAIEWCHFRWPWVTPDPGFKVTIVLKGEYLQSDAFYRHSYCIGRKGHHRQLTYSLQPHCSYVNRANFSQASRWFVSDSWAFLFIHRRYGNLRNIQPHGSLQLKRQKYLIPFLDKRVNGRQNRLTASSTDMMYGEKLHHNSCIRLYF